MACSSCSAKKKAQKSKVVIQKKPNPILTKRTFVAKK